ncbi:MAG: ABC transporter ATP-binding protein [Planctomycetes bacterium]|nr:ABC transporter ATP-binding protein [Planctomycetota bacterium]
MHPHPQRLRVCHLQHLSQPRRRREPREATAAWSEATVDTALSAVDERAWDGPRRHSSPTSGSYRFRGIEIAELNRDQRARLRRHYLGFVFQGYNLLKRTSAVENVELPLIYRGVPAGERRRRAREILASVGLEGWEKHAPSELSGGQQQRVAIARAIVTSPSVLMADEPTGNLDSARSREIMELLTRLNQERGITIVMVTHEPDMAAHARRIIRFLDGQVESDDRNGSRA